jgi:hypothetical protein
MQALRKSDPARYDKVIADARRAAAEYARANGVYDEEAVAAVDRFREDRGLNYQGNPPGLVDARMIDALRAAYFEKKKERIGKMTAGSPQEHARIGSGRRPIDA